MVLESELMFIEFDGILIEENGNEDEMENPDDAALAVNWLRNCGSPCERSVLILFALS